jgi:hypothetical protein
VRFRRVFAAIGLVGLMGAEGAVAAKSDGPPTRTCRERIEVNRPIQFGGPQSVAVGRISFSGLARYADPEEFAETYNERSGIYGIKSGIGVRANRNVKLSIAPAQRSVAGLSYTMDQRIAEPGVQPVVLFSPCRPSQRAFSYRGKVGKATGFSGGLAVTEPMCLVLEARTRGRAPVRRAISLGMGDSCAQP